MSMINYSELDLKEESVIRINRVAKVNSRGKRFSFSTLVVIGDGKAHVGIGAGKANEVIVSITKAKDDAKQNLVKVHVAKAVMNSLSSLQDIRVVAKKRGKTPKTLFEI